MEEITVHQTEHIVHVKKLDILRNNDIKTTSLYAAWAPVATTINYSSSCNVQTYTVTVTGTYKLEVYGAQGGGSSGGKGGYAKGNKSLTEGTVLYIVAGGQGTQTAGGCNGGGAVGTGNVTVSKGYGGGGATHIATQTGLLSSLSSSTSSVLIVAGGGGGAAGNMYVVNSSLTNAKGTAGSFGTGGAGGAGIYKSSCFHATTGGGGGGGSNYVGSLSSTSTTLASRTGNGYAIITFVS